MENDVNIANCQGHPHVTIIFSPSTKKGTSTHSENATKCKSASSNIFFTNNYKHLINAEVGDFVVKNSIKTENQCLQIFKKGKMIMLHFLHENYKKLFLSV